MMVSVLRTTLFVAVIVFGVGHAREGMAQSVSDPILILRLPPSARASGLGGAGSAVSDPHVSYFNPGGLGIYSLEGRAAIVLSRDKQSLNRVHDNTLLVIGMPLLSSTGGSHPTRIAIAAAYHKQRFGILNVPLSGGTTEDFISHGEYYTVALAFEHVIQLGVGATYKEFDQAVMGADGTGHGIGVSARIPIFRALRALKMLDHAPQWGGFDSRAAVTFAYSWANRGEYKTGGAMTRPLQKDDFYGASADAGLDYGDATLFHVLATHEDWDYKDANRIIHREGVEVDLLGIFKIRRGRFWSGGGSSKSPADGLAIHLNGMTRWISALKTRSGGEKLPWYVTNLDVSYQASSHGSAFDSDFSDLSITFDFGPLLGQ